MPELCVERAVEPDQDEALSHLVGIGLGRAITVIGDLLGVRLTARAPIVRFVSLSDEPRLGPNETPETSNAVRSDLTGSLAGYASVCLHPSTATYVASRLGAERGWRDASPVRQDALVTEIGSILLSSVIEGLRPILPARGSFSPPELTSTNATRWHEMAQSTVGGLHVQLEIEDDASSLRFEFYFLTGPRGLDLLLTAVDDVMAVA